MSSIGKLRTRSKTRGFTLVELLVVITIVLIVSAIVLPTVINAVSNRQTSEAARILQAALVGARDAAIRSNSPRGIRLIPDPTLLDPPYSAGATAGSNTLAYSRLINIEIPGDYSEGKVTIAPMPPLGATIANYPPAYPEKLGGSYPYPDVNDSVNPQKVLMLEESPYQGGYVVGATAIPNPPTSWYWNIRVGEKIRINDSGATYTIVGPCTVNPNTVPGQNPELFVNVGPPGTTPPLLRNYYSDTSGATSIATHNPEFLYVVNGQDDDKDGYVDEGFNGIDDNPINSTVMGVTTSNYNGHVDEVMPFTVGTLTYGSEWEVEKWLGATSGSTLIDPGTETTYPTPTWLAVNYQKMAHDLPYSITRRPVPVEGARETQLPGSVVIDASTFLTTEERSRGLPIDPNSLICEILVNADGQIVPQTIYSTPASFNVPFFHLWLADRRDVVPPVDNRSATTPVPYLLPMPAGSLNYPHAGDTTGRTLNNDRMLVTIFTKSGLITTSSIENFDGTSTFTPFAESQLGVRDAK
ncbi:pilus assembly FimT family protein [Singulisphaera rosea]